MIINHTHRFIFVHIPKTAGTSVTHALSALTRYCDQEIGGSRLGGIAAAYYGERFGLRKHGSMAEIVKVVGPETWGAYFTFAFVRNPYHRLISAYYFMKAWEGTPERYKNDLLRFPTIDDFLASNYWMTRPGPDGLFLPQVRWLTAEGDSRIGVSFIGRTERIAEDLAAIHAKLGLPTAEAPPPVANRTPPYAMPRVWPKPFIKRMRRRYAEDFALLGYDPLPPPV